MALFTAAEAQAFKVGDETPLADRDSDELDAAAARIKERFEDICGVAFETTEVTVTLDGRNRTTLLLPHGRVTAVSAVSVDDDALDVADVTVYDHGELYYETGWTSGARNIEVTYEHGYAAVPESIKWAALIVAVKELTDSDLMGRYISRADETGTTQFSVAGGEGRWFGIPAVDSILKQYSEKVPALG